MHDSRYRCHLAKFLMGFLLASHDIPLILLLTSLADDFRPLEDPFSTNLLFLVHTQHLNCGNIA